ncbi:hypothetical protein ABZ847_27090 [Streptomyces bauhiniae]
MIHRDIPSHEQILAPAAILEFSDDLRVADVSPLRNFLAARLSELARDQAEGTDARWASEHLARTIDAACRDLADAQVSWEIELTEGDINRPGHVQRLRQNLATSWDGLVQTAGATPATPTTFPAGAPCGTAASNTPSSSNRPSATQPIPASSTPAARKAMTERSEIRRTWEDLSDRSG